VVAAGPGDETLVWLYGPAVLDAPVNEVPQPSRRFDAGGYYTLRGRRAWAMVRCHTYRDRPAHVDMLHFDLWFDGVNVLGDSGSYRYFAPEGPESERYFKDITAHNTVEIDGEGPLRMAGRFLWLPWPKALCRLHEADAWEGEHYAYRSRPWRTLHRRSVRKDGDTVWIVDDLLEGEGQHEVALRWHFADGEHKLDAEARVFCVVHAAGTIRIALEGPPSLVPVVLRGSADPGRVTGWASHYYAQRVSRPTLVFSGRCSLPVRLRTRIDLTESCDR
jgi:hypothetical protein